MLFSLGIVVLLGIVGLGIDIGRMYVAHGEAQTFADGAAMFAAGRLNGQATGINSAVARVDAFKTQKRWGFETTQFTNVVVTFANDKDAPEADWKDQATAAASPAGLFFVKVTATAPVDLTLLSVVVGGAQRSSKRH